MDINLMPFIWIAVAIPVLILMQRWIHAHLHGISLLLLGKPERAVLMYAIILFPGVLLHELSHWVFATLLGVRTGTFSLVPRLQDDGTIQLGYVEYFKGRTLGPIRESLIGGAPLIVGTAVILLIGLRIFNVEELGVAIQSGRIDELSLAMGTLFSTNDFLVWLYLLFAIANGMLPSRSDRKAWPAFLVIMAVLGLVLYATGFATVVADGLVRPATIIFGYLGLAFSMAIGVALLFMIILSLIESLISRIKGQSVVYGSSDAISSTNNVSV
ncbi:MAG: hypothetical protein AAF490_32455 [Chloroflexota bacterium]